MSPPERLEFENYIEADDANLQLMNEIEPSWSQIKGHPFHSTDEAKAWDLVHNRLKDAGLTDPENKGRSITRQWIVGIAAGLILLVGLGIILRQYSPTSGNNTEVIEVKTGSDHQTLIHSLSDGSIVYMAGNSEMSVPEQFSGNSRNISFKGRAFFDIESLKGKPFIIETAQSIVEVVGTAFTINTNNPSGIEVEVERGKVKVSLKSAPESAEYVVAGEKVFNTGSALKKSVIPGTESSKWYLKSMHFKDEPLINILKVINKNFGTNIILQNPQTGSKRLTVTLEDLTDEKMIQIICIPLNLESSINGNTVILSEEKGK